ncbi:transglutaminase family protein [Undibacterium griseum]|uniref:Transglutaminase family protein n=1 Tax=Undibacterium griseum TaxID=2762295 RepID=A0ABR6YK79_9BURK|nr:transglutaminase family protein [Undibacterium griseum]MBC3884310.1 transglutaminase family protein [Undibacterium griseum]
MSKQLHIRHQTTYQYSAASSYTIQQLRLTPRLETHQQTLEWRIQTNGQLRKFSDAYGNLSHTLTITQPHQGVSILASGTVVIHPLLNGRILDQERMSPLLFTVSTTLTAAGAAIREFAQQSVPRLQEISTAEAIQLAIHIQQTVLYRAGTTQVTSTADEVFVQGCGVCQDHAHLFLACCHSRGIPARYVSGYIDPGSGEHAETHAWVDVWVQDGDYHGWISIDVTHARLMDTGYCRLAIGRDYDSAAPVRGVRRGGGQETMSAQVLVTTG